MKGVYAMVSKDKFITPEQINAMLRVVRLWSDSHGAVALLVGGVAMQAFGSPRLTKDVDFVVPFVPDLGLTRLGPINFGGEAFIAPDGGKVDFVVRNDEYKELYDHALENPSMTSDGIQIVSPEHLATMKLAAREPKHILDLQWLLNQPGLVDRKKAQNLVYRFVGGRYAVDGFLDIMDRTDFERERSKEERDSSSYP